MGALSDFLEEHFRHFNARETLAAARAWREHLDRGGHMLVALAGAMSTAEIGRLLGPLILQGKVHAVCATGANLEEDVFRLLAQDEYEAVPNWRALRAEDEKELYDRGLNRVTDTCIPEAVIRYLEERLLRAWRAACAAGRRHFPHEYLWQVLEDPDLATRFQVPPEESWVWCARKQGIPIFAPGWEDSTTGNLFAAACFRGDVTDPTCVRTGTEQMEALMRWYLEHCGTPESTNPGAPSVGFFQIGGGIAGDFAICAVPTLIQDLKRTDVPFWGYFAQVSDATTSYGGYSGAVPNEKITWGKLDVGTPRFMIESDATIVAPLIFAYILGL